MINVAYIFLLACIGGFAVHGMVAMFENTQKPKVYEIKTCQDLKDMNKDLDGVYILMNDIDGSDCK